MNPQELGLKLVELLMSGKQPCKYNDALWDIAIKLLNMRWEIDLLSMQQHCFQNIEPHTHSNTG